VRAIWLGFALAVLALLPAPAPAAGRARYGGTLRVAAPPTSEADPALADVPEAAALSTLLAPPICRVDPARGVVPTLADLARTGAGRLTITVRPGQRRTPRGALGAADLVARWNALTQASTLSPYRALLYPLRGEGRLSPQAASGQTLEVGIQVPWPDLEKGLCHPALGLTAAAGPYVPGASRGTLDANPGFPEGRPFPDHLQLQLLGADERRGARLLALGQVDLLLGAAEDADAPAPPPPGPALFATYLLYRPARVGAGFRAVAEAALDPDDLVQNFVPAPAVPMRHLLPPLLMGAVPPPPPAPAAAPPARGPLQELLLLHDAASDEQRAVAERIQVRLHDRGYRLALKGLPRGELRARWARGDYDLLLDSLLMPPSPGPALTLALEVGGRHDLLAVEMTAIGSVADTAARDQRARERAAALRATLPMIPLYARGVKVRATAKVSGLRMDAFGLPRLDEVFLSQDP
jgi:hypothetical protein